MKRLWSIGGGMLLVAMLGCVAAPRLPECHGAFTPINAPEEVPAR